MLEVIYFWFLMPLDTERRQEMSVSLDISVCKDCDSLTNVTIGKNGSVSTAALLLFCYQHVVTLCYHKLPLPRWRSL